MSDFTVEIVRIQDPVENHPDADRLSIIKIGGYVCISGKLEDGSHRYKQGDLVAYVPEGAVVPDWLMKRDGYWDTVKNKPAFKKVKAKKLRGVFSQGLLIACSRQDGEGRRIESFSDDPFLVNSMYVEEGTNVAEFLGITKYEPVVPQNMMGEKGAHYGITKSYDFDSIQKQTTLFSENEIVAVTEKLHGTNFQVGYVPGLDANDGEYLGFYVTSKGLGKNGYNLKINEQNAGNLYVKMFLSMPDLQDGLKILSEKHGDVPVRLFGEIYGKGVQDLTYGTVEPKVAFFDIMVGDEYVPYPAFEYFADGLGVPRVPLLYIGPYNKEALEDLRDGEDTVSRTNVREGIVIESYTGEKHPRFGRKIAKWVSPDYLLRSNGTEYN